MKMSELDSCSYSRYGLKTYIKSPVIFGEKGVNVFPLCYLTKPRHLSDEEWNDFLDWFNSNVWNIALKKEA